MNLEFDFVVGKGTTSEQTLEDMLKGFDGLVASITKQVGPAGGWPVAVVSGSTDAVVAFADHYGYEV